MTRLARQGQSRMRVVDHPSFKNYTLEETVAVLRDASIGESIFRPSSKGRDFLTLSYRGVCGMVLHVLVTEKDKPHENALGRKLQVQGEDFEDLDEVIARYVNPVTARMAELTEHHRFSPGTEAEVEQLVREDKQKTPDAIVYRLGLDEKHPGFFKIIFMPADKIYHQAISVRSASYRLRRRDFLSLPDLLQWFKRHWKDSDADKSKKRPAAGEQRRKR
jgi:transcription elongation factor SPT6